MGIPREELMKTERVLEGHLCNILAMIMSLCDFDTKYQVKSRTEYPALEKNLDIEVTIKVKNPRQDNGSV